MRITLNVEVNGIPSTVVAGPGEFIRLEREYDISASELQQRGRVEHLAFLAWSAMKREGTLPQNDAGQPLTFDQFIDGVGELDYDSDDSGN